MRLVDAIEIFEDCQDSDKWFGKPDNFPSWFESLGETRFLELGNVYQQACVVISKHFVENVLKRSIK